MSIEIITNKINNVLENPIKEDPSLIATFKLTCPIEPSSTRRLMDDLDFKHCPVKKSHMISANDR